MCCVLRKWRMLLLVWECHLLYFDFSHFCSCGCSSLPTHVQLSHHLHVICFFLSRHHCVVACQKLSIFPSSRLAWSGKGHAWLVLSWWQAFGVESHLLWVFEHWKALSGAGLGRCTQSSEQRPRNKWMWFSALSQSYSVRLIQVNQVSFI